MQLYSDADVYMVVKHWIDSHGELSHREIADRAGITTSTFSRIYNGKKETSLSAVHLLNIAAACGEIPCRTSKEEK